MSEHISIRLIVVDDHQLALSGMRLFLSAFPDIELVGEATDGFAAIQLCETLQPDVVLMDMMMPAMDGVEATRQIKARFPHIKILVLTSYEEGGLVERALRAGANGYLLKNVAAHELARAIRMAHTGRSVLAPEATEALMSVLQQPNSTSSTLTEREREVLNLMARGSGNSEIGERLGISRSTVKFHINSIFTKLEVTTRAEAIALAYQRRLVVPD